MGWITERGLRLNYIGKFAQVSMAPEHTERVEGHVTYERGIGFRIGDYNIEGGDRIRHSNSDGEFTGVFRGIKFLTEGVVK